ncbi:hypothetical protein F2Q70_00029993 [Brassica cretica]|uniref:Uncharacterized protein n=1 Tax=Brassica cretica TaxID=69181 RepID=A0A8S9FNN4_BRACR|nr:hypothetical protein F2Q70_00029993 [Brassica cretica]
MPQPLRISVLLTLGGHCLLSMEVFSAYMKHVVAFIHRSKCVRRSPISVWCLLGALFRGGFVEAEDEGPVGTRLNEQVPPCRFLGETMRSGRRGMVARPRILLASLDCSDAPGSV